MPPTTTGSRPNPSPEVAAAPHTKRINFEKPLDWGVVKGETALITGGASGIGLAITTALAENGARVALLDVNETSGSQIEQDLAAKGFEAKFIKTDVTSWESQLAAFKDVLAWSDNRLDIVVTSAGVRPHNIKDLIIGQQEANHPDEDPIKPPMSTIDVNLTGTYYSTYLSLTYFTRLAKTTADATASGDSSNWRPQLVLISSMAGYREQVLAPDYCASKHGVRGVWKGIRNYGEDFGNFQANLLAPTFIDTPLVPQAVRNRLVQRGLIMGTVADVVSGAMRCICDDSVEGKSILFLSLALPEGIADTEGKSARAICCVKGDEGNPGSRNFDLGDDIDDYSSGRALLEHVKANAFRKTGS